ncbi:hypothetical protein MLD38_009042 [Melastoma candidum]|nr:hypothetical protein MLD38_009042 [Melastoma candidum]
MSISSPNPNKSSRKLNFPTPQSLSDYLQTRLPSDSFSTWGVKPGTKNLHNLWLEISEGEASLEPDSNSGLSIPLRTLHVVSLRIFAPEDDCLVLVEFQQEMSDGSLRRRERFLSEKMKPGERPEDAAVRAVREELGNEAVVRLIDGSYRTRVEERESASYPGLPACYVMHFFDARAVEGLPLPGEKEEFWTEEVGESEVEGKALTVKRHCWKWVLADCDRA